MIQIGLIFVLVAVLGFAYWRKAAYLLFYWILVAGAARKWLFPGSADAVFFLGHVLLIGVYARLLMNSGRKRNYPISPAFLALSTLLIAWCIVSVFNPELPSLMIGVLGL